MSELREKIANDLAGRLDGWLDDKTSTDSNRPVIVAAIRDYAYSSADAVLRLLAEHGGVKNLRKAAPMWRLIPKRVRIRRGAVHAEYFRKGYSAGAAGANARLAGIANLHRPIDRAKVCRAGCGEWPCSTYQIAAGEEWKVYP